MRRGRSHARRFAQRAHQFRERRDRLARRAEDNERVEAHQPPHVYGCLTCFVARQQERHAAQGDQP